jgi:hypothetical protein
MDAVGFAVEQLRETGDGIGIPICPHERRAAIVAQGDASDDGESDQARRACTGGHVAACRGALSDTVQLVHETVRGTTQSFLVNLVMIGGCATSCEMRKI